MMAGLAYMGNYIKKDKASVPLPKVSIHEKPNSKTIYDSNRVRKIKKKHRKTAKNLVGRSRDPINTNVIPRFFNQIGRKKKKVKVVKLEDLQKSQQQTQENFSSDMVEGKHTFLFDIANKINDNSSYLQAFNNQKSVTRDEIKNLKSSYLGQFEPQTFDNLDQPASQNDSHYSNDKMVALSLERELAQNGGWTPFSEKDRDMTYNIIPKEHFVHNNMQPFYTGRGMQFNEYNEENRNSKVWLYTGSSRNYVPKREVRALFYPEKHITNVDTQGMPNYTSFFQSRFIPGREKRNQLPFEQQMIPPGLNLDYNDESQHGVHDPYRPLARTVDETRTSSNPKVTFTMPVIPGKKGDRRPVVGPVFKRRPETYRHYNFDWYQKSRGIFTGPTVRDLYTLRPTDKIVHKPHFNHAKFRQSQHLTSSRYAHTYTWRRRLPEFSVRNVTGINGVNGNTPVPFQNKESFRIPATQRNTANFGNYLKPATGLTEARIAQNLDRPRPTHKQDLINQNHDGFTQGQTKSRKTQNFDRPKSTHKQDLINQNHDGFTEGLTKSRKAQNLDRPKTTHKQDLINQNHDGFTEGLTKSRKAQNLDRPKTTHKQDLINQNHEAFVQGQSKARITQNLDRPKITHKQDLINQNHDAFVQGQNRARITQNLDRPKITHKQDLINQNHDAFVQGQNRARITQNLVDLNSALL